MTSALVIGAGLNGLSAAWQLAMSGLDVTVVDEAAQPAWRNHWNTCGYSYCFAHPADSRMAMLADTWWPMIEGRAGVSLRFPTGRFDLGLSDSSSLGTIARIAKDLGIDFEQQHPSAVGHLPWLAPGDHDALYYQPGAGVLDVAAGRSALAGLCRDLGVQSVLQKAVGWESTPSGVAVFLQNDEARSADLLVLAAGQRITTLLPSAAPLIPLSEAACRSSSVEGQDHHLLYVHDDREVVVRSLCPGASTGGSRIDVLAADGRLPEGLASNDQLPGDPSRSRITLPDGAAVLDRVDDQVFVMASSEDAAFLAPVLGRAISELAIDGDTDFEVDQMSLTRFQTK